MSTTFFIGENEEKSTWETCTCGNYAEMHPICIGIDDSRTYELEESGPYYSKRIYKILKCPACDSVIIVRYTTHGDEEEDEKLGRMPKEYTREVLYALPKVRHSSIPQPISEIIGQAESVISASPRAAFVLCRAALEEICREREVKETRINKKGEITHIGLKAKLETLFQQEGMSEDLQVIIRGIKDIGDEGAHGSQSGFSESVSSEDVQALLGLLDYALECLYVAQARKKEAQDKLGELKTKVLGIQTTLKASGSETNSAEGS